MKLSLAAFAALIGMLLSGCQNSKKEEQSKEVISQRYIHKYGYDVSKDEWESTGYPGQVITTLRNGVTIASTYENGVLHGVTTYTYPHSQTIESRNLYERGTLLKKTRFNIRGIPFKEENYLSPTHFKITTWYNKGTPMSVEEYSEDELLEGEYFNEKNETEYRVTNGCGVRIVKNLDEKMVLRETIENGFPILRETFHVNGIPYMITPLSAGKVHGVKKEFASSGEPLSVENWCEDKLHGLAIYYQNGYKYLEVTYNQGQKEGIERHYIDGDIVVEETEWLGNQKHGSSVIFLDGMTKTDWYYNNQRVSKEKYSELCAREVAIAIMNERSKPKDIDE